MAREMNRCLFEKEAESRDGKKEMNPLWIKSVFVNVVIVATWLVSRDLNLVYRLDKYRMSSLHPSSR